MLRKHLSIPGLCLALSKTSGKHGEGALNNWRRVSWCQSSMTHPVQEGARGSTASQRLTRNSQALLCMCIPWKSGENGDSDGGGAGRTWDPLSMTSQVSRRCWWRNTLCSAMPPCQVCHQPSFPSPPLSLRLQKGPPLP